MAGKRGTERKKKPSKATDESGKDKEIKSLKNKIKRLEDFNKSLGRENSELGRVNADLRKQNEELTPGGELEELAVLKPDDIVMMKIVCDGYTLNYTDWNDVPHVYTKSSPEFEMLESELYMYSKHKVCPVKDLIDMV